VSKPSFRIGLLLDRVRAVTKQRGKKTELAQILEVPIQRVSEWLNETHLPSGETVLQLLEWVTAEEAKQKTPASVDTTRKGEQTRKGNDEKSKTGPPRKR
jgi:hypothetical protein